jgi:hypothetical protein
MAFEPDFSPVRLLKLSMSKDASANTEIAPA